MEIAEGMTCQNIGSNRARGTHLLETAEGGRACQMLWCGDTRDSSLVKTVSSTYMYTSSVQKLWLRLGFMGLDWV